MFGFTAILLQEVRHPELEEVVKTLPMSRILLEMDYTTSSGSSTSAGEIQYTIWVGCCVERVAELKGMPF